jgi:DNA polymerase-3 subunit gamma/tau
MAREHYLVLARKWRPQSFEDVVGQEHITRTLQNSIASGRIGHAFLFIGSRGIGKTTTARVLAKALNCTSVDAPTPHPCNQCENCLTISTGNSIDVVEIDGASNNTVEDVRQIRENIRLLPSRSRYKIYIIDEVHQLSTSAFNALLKTLEEPPAHAIFILATTESGKIPATIVSRCQRYDFRRVGLNGLRDLLRQILDAEGVKCSEEALNAIARAADGGVRDAESVLEQLISFCGAEITYRDVYDVLGLVDWRIFHDLCDAVSEKDVARLLQLVDTIVAHGKDLSQFVQDALLYFRNLLVCKTADPKALLSLPDEDIVEMQARAERFSLTDLIRLVEQFAELSKDFDSQLAQRIALEALLIRICRVSVEVSVDSVLEKLMLLGGGAGAQVSGPPAVAPAPRRAPASPVQAPANPPEPGAVEVAQETAPEPIFLTLDNLRTAGPKLLAEAVKDMLGINIWLSHARPVGIEGDALVLEFGTDQGHARKTVEKPENRRAIEDGLKACSANIGTFRTQQVEAAPASDEPENGGAQGRLPFAGHVTESQAREALQDEGVAKVVEVFRGRIVDIVRQARPEE